MNFKKTVSTIICIMAIMIPAMVFAVAVDTDGDFMPDAWEIQYGLNQFDKSDASGDKDTDSYTNFEEYSAHTDPESTPSHPGTRSANELVLRGRTLLENWELVPANTAFELALEVNGAHQEANFFYSITRLMSHVERDQDDTGLGTLDSMKEILDRIGLPAEGRTLYNWTADFNRDINMEIVLPVTTPTGQELQEYLMNYLLPEIDNSLVNLSHIGTDFSTYLTLAMFRDDWIFGMLGDIEVDYGDVVLLKASLHFLKASIYSYTAYNGDIDIYDIADMFKTGTFSINQMLIDYPDLMTIERPDNFQDAKAAYMEAIDLYFEASGVIRNETDDQIDDLVTFDPLDLPDEEEFRLTLAELKQSLTQPTDIRPDIPDLRDATGDNIRVDLTQYFDSPIVIRDYLPLFVDNRPCSSPDPTLSGIFPYASHDDWSLIFAESSGITLFSAHWSNGYYADMFVEDDSGALTSVTATGPGISGTLNFDYYPLSGTWWAADSPYISSAVPAAPQTYNVTLNDGFESCSYTKTITGYVQEFATYLSPDDQAGPNFSFMWIGIPDSDGYRIELSNQDNEIWSTDAWSSSWYYYGPQLIPGQNYTYLVRSAIETDDVENYSFAEADFTYWNTSPPTGSITGKVTADGSPVQSVRVRAHTYQLPYDNNRASAWTDANGNYTLSGLPPGYYLLEVDSYGDYGGEYYDNAYHRYTAQPVQVNSSAVSGGNNFTLSRNGSISGRVIVQDTGQPLANTYVIAQGFDDGWKWRGDTRTDADGYYTITGLEPTEYRVNAQNVGYYTEYYNSVYYPNDADPVNVPSGSNIGNINFYLGTTIKVCHSFDNDNNWEIGDFELLDAIDEWARGNLGDFDLLDLIDFWAAGCYQWNGAAGDFEAGC